MPNISIHINLDGDRVAVVNNVIWTKRQTEQALRDSVQCKCNNCVCCNIRDLYFKEEDSAI